MARISQHLCCYPDQERLKEVLSYDPETGLFRWIQYMGSNAVAGQIAGSVSANDGYVRIQIDGKHCLGHVLAWIYMTGERPAHLIDHKNKIEADNSWDNLRKANNSQNAANSKLNKRNLSGLKGVITHGNGRYTSQICKNGVTYHLGSFDAPEKAHEAYMKKAIELHGEFARAA